MAEIIQHHHKDEEIQFDIIIKSRSVKCHSAMDDIIEYVKADMREILKETAKQIAPFITYVPK